LKKLLLMATVAFLGVSSAMAQTATVGVEKELNKADRTAVVMTVTDDIGPVLASVELRSTLANAPKSAGETDLVLGARYEVPVAVYGISPFVKGEYGVTIANKQNYFWGVEAGVHGAINDDLTWEAAQRVREAFGEGTETRTRVTLSYDLNDNLKLGGSALLWRERGESSFGLGVDVTNKF